MRYYLLIAICIVAGMFSACHDDNDDPMPSPENGWTVQAVSGSSVDGEGQVLFPRLASFERLSVMIEGYDAARDSSVLVTTDADWLLLDTDTLAADGTLTLTTAGNDEGQRRTALLIFTSQTNPALRATLSVSQLSDADQDSNAGDARSVLYVGYGYDIYAALDQPMAVRTKEPIINVEDLTANCAIFNFEPIHDSKLSRTDMNYYAAQTMSELASLLTEAGSDGDMDVAGCLKSCERVANTTKVTLNEQNLGYVVMTKTVASRVLDRGVLSFLRKYDDEKGGNSNRLALNYDFRMALREVRKLSGQKREKLVEDLLLTYGTHIVVQADLGGKLDYAFTMTKTETFNLTEQAKEEMQYTIGQLASSDRNYGKNHRVSSEKNSNGALQVWGGSAATRQLLKDDFKKLEQDGRIPPEHMQQWMASIQATATMTATEDMDVIHFELMPVWDLVPSDLRQDFLDATLLLAQRSDCQLPARFLNTDIYEINTNELDLFRFRDKPGNSLCHLLYYEDEPVLEVCSEYVPKIRNDERVIVAYPIYNRKIRMNQGFFYGDGIHQPAFVGFSGSNCYVNPVDSLPAGAIVKSFYYVNGNIMLKRPSKSPLTGRDRFATDDVLQLYSSDSYGGVTHTHPIVKIGSTFWTRYDITHQMYFAERPSGPSLDQVEDGVLYTQFQWAPNEEFLAYNGWTWGYDPNSFFEGNPNMKWFLPTPTQVRELQAYLGANPKALFRNQVSGFNAEFNGYYGWSNINNQNRKFPDRERQLRYKGELNVICSNNTNKYDDACIMVLYPDYTIRVIDDNTYTNNFRDDWRDNFYPVRGVRGWMFNYPKLSEFTENRR